MHDTEGLGLIPDVRAEGMANLLPVNRSPEIATALDRILLRLTDNNRSMLPESSSFTNCIDFEALEAD